MSDASRIRDAIKTLQDNPTGDAVEALSREIYALTSTTYQAAIRAEGAKLGLSAVGDMSPFVLASIESQAMLSARQISSTYSKDRQAAIDRGDVIAEFNANRLDWKAPQVVQYEGLKALNNAGHDVYAYTRVNNAPLNVICRLGGPPARIEDICTELQDEGTFTLDVAQANPMPAHLQCPHWIEYLPAPTDGTSETTISPPTPQDIAHSAHLMNLGLGAPTLQRNQAPTSTEWVNPTPAELQNLLWAAGMLLVLIDRKDKNNDA